MKPSDGRRASHAVRALGLLFVCVALLACGAKRERSTRIEMEDFGLPDGIQVLSGGDLHGPDESHPLNSGAGELLKELPSADREKVLAYEGAYGFSAILFDDSAVVANFSYEYATAEEAEAAAALVHDAMQATEGVARLAPVELDGGLQGERFAVTGAEGDSVYWFVGVRDATVVMIMVNGMDEATVVARLDAILRSLAEAG